jgi:hypothetical protein
MTFNPMHHDTELTWLKKKKIEGQCGDTCNASTQKAEAGELQVPCQPGLHRKTISTPPPKKIQ